MSQEVVGDLRGLLQRASERLLDPATPESEKAELAQTVLLVRRQLREARGCGSSRV